MRFNIIQSGSKGNATIIEHKGCVLLIDMGIPLHCLKEALLIWNKHLLDVDALLLTHSHSDHTSGVKYLDPLPIYCSEDTYAKGDINLIKPFESFCIGPFEIISLEASHDAPNTIGFLIKYDTKKIVYLTDTGYIPEKTLSYIKDADYYIIESNHDRRMLLKTNRPELLKQRILSDVGHLCNEDSAFYMSDAVGKNTKEIILAHLSQEANTPEKALQAYEKVFRKRKINTSNIKIRCASQIEMTIGGEDELRRV